MSKIYVSYKYRDSSVRPIPGQYTTTARQYVDWLGAKLVALGHTYKGEDDGQDLSNLSEERIMQLLRDRMYDSSMTIVFISKNMKETGRSEREQWIPWEVSYSLREKTREDRTSHTNAILAVVLPDENNSYSYFVENKGCLSGCRTWKIEDPNSPVFKIIRENMFNRNEPETRVCSNHGQVHVSPNHSFIYPVLWDEFINSINGHLDIASGIRENIDDYKLQVENA